MRNLALVIAFLLAPCGAVANDGSYVEQGLFSATHDTVEQSGCPATPRAAAAAVAARSWLDPLRINEWPEVRAVRVQLELERVPIVFVGCAVTPFKATWLGGLTAQDAHYRIYYPLGLDERVYTPPIIHELTHVFQGVSYGGLSAARENLSSARLELGADFLAGWLARRIGAFTPVAYHTNLQLIGRYRESAAAAHGSPEDRVAAFRRGYFLMGAEAASHTAAHNFFQTEAWHELGREE